MKKKKQKLFSNFREQQTSAKRKEKFVFNFLFE